VRALRRRRTRWPDCSQDVGELDHAGDADRAENRQNQPVEERRPAHYQTVEAWRSSADVSPHDLPRTRRAAAATDRDRADSARQSLSRRLTGSCTHCRTRYVGAYRSLSPGPSTARRYERVRPQCLADGSGTTRARRSLVLATCAAAARTELRFPRSQRKRALALAGSSRSNVPNDAMGASWHLEVMP
jgi:hypothetical protein